MAYKFKEQKDGTVHVMDGDNVVAKYKVDRHWREVNASYPDDSHISIRLYNRMRGYINSLITLNKEEIQEIP